MKPEEHLEDLVRTWAVIAASEVGKISDEKRKRLYQQVRKAMYAAADWQSAFFLGDVRINERP